MFEERNTNTPSEKGVDALISDSTEKARKSHLLRFFLAEG